MEKEELELKLKDADIMAMAIDIAVLRHWIDSRSPISDARLNYGEPYEYKNLTEKEIAYHKKRLGFPNT